MDVLFAGPSPWSEKRENDHGHRWLERAPCKALAWRGVAGSGVAGRGGGRTSPLERDRGRAGQADGSPAAAVPLHKTLQAY